MDLTKITGGLTLKAKDVPSMHAALLDLSPYISTFYEAFEKGIAHGKSYFDDINKSCDPHLQAHLVRYWAKKFLVQHDLNAKNEREDLSNSGIQLSIKSWLIRIRKSTRGSMPTPGHSKKLAGYYKQTLPGFDNVHNLLLLWNTTPAGDFIGLSLVYPLSATMLQWKADIPHPADAADTKTTWQPELENFIEVDEFGDLEIEPLDDEDNDNSEAGNQ